MLTSLKTKIKKCLPKTILAIISWMLHPKKHINKIRKNREKARTIKKTIKLHKESLQKLKNKEQIRCVFFALYDSAWKYDGVFQIMMKDSRFKPIVLVCPVVNYGREHMLQTMEDAYVCYHNKGYETIRSYDAINNKYIDVRRDINPDIIFYTNPYKGLIDDRYYINKFYDILTVYVSYNFGNSRDFNIFFNLPLHNLTWRNYAETSYHKSYAEIYATNHGENVVVTGYSGIENFISSDYKPKDVWIDKNHIKKRIIWAPHHSIEPVGIVYYSCFLKYMDFMLFTASKYQKSIELCFKPHPLLRNKLNQLWGKEKTDEYYHLWDTMPNTSINEGEYVDLFLESDAMIHDSGSFLIEYLYTKKPVMRTMNEIDPKTMFNDFALNALEVYYKAYNEQDIEQFIQNVIGGVDPMKEAREKFYQERLLPPNGKLPSENIIDDIIDSIKNQRVLAE